MRKTLAVCSALTVSLMTTGCYNNPHTSERAPSGKHSNIHSGPAVGPGTVDGGSTAGPQPKRADAHGAGAGTGGNHATSEGHATVQPTHSGALPAQGGLEHSGKAQPATGRTTAAPHGSASQTGNEPGAGRTEAPATKH